MEKITDAKGNETFIYTEEQLMARLKFFIGICLALTLTGIVFVVLYSLIFVTQPMNAIAPIDQKFFELIIPIATFLTGTLSGIMLAGNDKEAKMKALEAATGGGGGPDNSGKFKPSTPSGGGGFSASGSVGGLNMSYKSPSSPAAKAAPAPSFAKPAAPAASTTPAMSSTGKPMPVQEEGEEL